MGRSPASRFGAVGCAALALGLFSLWWGPISGYACIVADGVEGQFLMGAAWVLVACSWWRGRYLTEWARAARSVEATTRTTGTMLNAVMTAPAMRHVAKPTAGPMIVNVNGAKNPTYVSE